jgi:hypothetical protein
MDMEKDIETLIEEIDQIRLEMKDAVNRIDPGKIIYPGWTIKEVIGHITAWEIVIDKGLIAFLKGDPPYFLNEQDFDIFNAEAVNYRSDWSLEEILKEWADVRESLLNTIRKLKEDDLDVEMVLPWGSERTVAELIEIAGEHEAEHMEDVSKLLI